MTPPQLTTDAPVLNVFQPVLVGVHVLLRVEVHFTIHDRLQGNLCEVLHFEEPLQREARFDGCIGVALRIAHLVGVVFNLLHESCFLQVFGNLLATVEAVHAHVEGRLLADGAVGVEDVDGLQLVCLAQHVVVLVVGRRYLQTARAKLNVYVAVFNHGNNAVHQRHNHLATLQPLVLGVFGVDTHGRIAHDGLGAGRGYYGIVALAVLMNNVAGLL